MQFGADVRAVSAASDGSRGSLHCAIDSDGGPATVAALIALGADVSLADSVRLGRLQILAPDG